MRPSDPPVFSRRSFLFFILLAPACLLAVGGIVAVLQYKQFQAMVAPSPSVAEAPFGSAEEARLDTLLARLRAFPNPNAPDTLRLSAEDLTVLAAASPTVRRQHLRIRFEAGDSLLLLQSSQRVDARSGRFARLLQRLSPIRDGWLNARVEGLPEFKSGALALSPDRGFLNGAKVPRAALAKRAGFSPKDFLDPVHAPEYAVFLGSIDSVFYREGVVVMVRRGD